MWLSREPHLCVFLLEVQIFEGGAGLAQFVSNRLSLVRRAFQVVFLVVF